MTELKEYDDRLYYKGRTYAALEGFLHAIAEDLDIDESQLVASAQAFKQAGKQVTNPEVLAAIVMQTDEQQYAVDPQQVEDICQGLSPEECSRAKRKRALIDSDQDIIRFEEEDLHDILNAYARMKGR
jgi:hypothetical protein